jgi:hypothetical protein
VKGLSEGHQLEGAQIERGNVLCDGPGPPDVVDPGLPGSSRSLGKHVGVRVEADRLIEVTGQLDGEDAGTAADVEKATGAVETELGGQRGGQRSRVRWASGGMVGSAAPGRADIVQDIDGVLANYLSTSFAAPHLFGDRLNAFTADVRGELQTRSPDGRFWDWPGDTEILLARRPERVTAG